MPWLWCRPAATAPIRLLAWEIPCAAGVALKRQEGKKKKKEKRNSCCGSAEMNLTSFQEDAGLIPDLAQWVGDLALP